jgi:HK97 family phage major capsid protein
MILAACSQQPANDCAYSGGKPVKGMDVVVATAPAGELTLRSVCFVNNGTKTVSIDADVRAMSVDAFEAWLVERLANKIEKAVDAGILNGGGSTSGECLGIKTSKTTQDGTYTKAAMKWDDLTKIMGKLPGQYHANATFVMPPALFFGEVLGMKDSTGNRVVVNDPQEPRKYNILGFPVIVDGNAATDEVYFGDLKQYKFNFAGDIEVTSSDEVDFRVGSRVWRAMTLADGKLADPNAIVRYIRAT